MTKAQSERWHDLLRLRRAELLKWDESRELHDLERMEELERAARDRAEREETDALLRGRKAGR